MSKKYPRFCDLNEQDFRGIIPCGLVNELLTPTKRKQFEKWMCGQTMSMYGYYESDFSMWFRSQKLGIKNPRVLD